MCLFRLEGKSSWDCKLAFSNFRDFESNLSSLNPPTSVYFCIPLVIGKFIFDYTEKVSAEKWQSDAKTGALVKGPKEVERTKARVDREGRHARETLDNMFKDLNLDKEAVKTKPAS